MKSLMREIRLLFLTFLFLICIWIVFILNRIGYWIEKLTHKPLFWLADWGEEHGCAGSRD